MMKKILLLTDFSEVSKHAIRFAQALFKGVPAKFCLVNAYPLQGDLYGMGLLLEASQENAGQQLYQLQKSLKQEDGPPYHAFRSLAVPGGPVGAVESILASEHFDFVVVGATGAGNSEWLGSVATALIRQLKTNVLVVPATAPIRPMQQVVLAADYQTIRPVHVLNPLKDLIRLRNAELTLLTIHKPDNPETLLSEISQDLLTDYFLDIRTHRYTLDDERVLHGIEGYLATHPADLLVTIPHQKGLFEALTGQSLTRQLAYHPRVPLLALSDNTYSAAIQKTIPYSAWQDES